MGVPSRMASATSLNRSSSADTVHLLSKAQQRPTSRFACGVRGRLTKRFRQFRVRVTHFDASDDGLALLWMESSERLLVVFDIPAADCLFERRSSCDVFGAVQIRHIRSPSFPSQFVAKTIEDGLPQIRLQRADATGLEALDPLNRLQQCFLDKVVRIRKVARVSGKTATGPALQRLQVPREKPFDRALISGTGSADQLERRLEVLPTIGC